MMKRSLSFPRTSSLLAAMAAMFWCTASFAQSGTGAQSGTAPQSQTPQSQTTQQTTQPSGQRPAPPSGLSTGGTPSQTGAAPQTGAAQAAPTAPAAPALPPHKIPPAAKTADEYAAYNAAASNTDLAAEEKAADDFAAKYPQSDLRGLLYSNIMRRYQQQNDSEKTLEMGRKVLTYEPNDPVALVMTATVLAERTREGDLDREERYDEALKYAQRALDTTKTDLMVPANATSEQIESAEKTLESMAHSAIGMVDLNRQNDAAAAQEFQKSIDLSSPGQIEPLTYLRLALAQDHQKQYPAALASANKAVESSPANSPVAMLAKQEVDRLSKLTGASAPTSPQNPTSTPH
ncbi:MAG: hypothetical protein JOZ10_18255 [Acidobacteria bacterium]|nr:hypothetical protein [Acidobacteriota bacterium]MBV9146675.1 hypothetical protein [Acidobacteriota bacterium]